MSKKTVARRRVGLQGKIMIGVACGMLLIGLVIAGVVAYETASVVRRQMDRRAYDLATNLGDAAAARLLKGEILEIHALIGKYSVSPGVAYALVRDGKGAVVASSLGAALPEELTAPTAASASAETRRTLQLHGKTMYETTAPILEGRVGAASVGISADSIAAEVRRAVLPLVGLIAAALAVGLVASLVAARRITRRVLSLKEAADRISKGDLEAPVGIEANDEIGDVARSLERMRSSLRAAMIRLGRTHAAPQANGNEESHESATA
jgi:HAMP domain-containing protein